MSSQSTELSTLCWIATCKTNRNWEAALFICSASVLIEHGSHWVKQSSLVMKSYKKERKWSRSVVSDSLWPHGLYRLFRPWDFPGKNTGVGCHGIFQARILEWVAISFSRGSSWLRDWILVSCILGRCFTIWATQEARAKKLLFQVTV